MSQINDALKRAGEAPEPPPLPGTPPPLPPLPSSAPVGGFRTIPPPPASSGLQMPVIIVCAALCFIVAVASFLVVRGLTRKGANSLKESLERAAAREKVIPAKDKSANAEAAEAESPKAASTTAKPAVNAAPKTSTPVPIRTLATPTAPAAAAPTNRIVTAVGTNAFPPLKVQGIFYRAKNPSAVLNNKTVFVGDHVFGITVVDITSDSVTVEANGNKKTLTLY
jgi:hypothetical protein